MVWFLVRRESKLDVQTDVAVRRLEKLEKENFQLENEEHKASNAEALADRTKIVELAVDKWFVDMGYGFGKALEGEIVFINASAVRRRDFHDRHRRVGASRERRCSSPGEVVEHAELGDAARGRRRETRRGQAKWHSK